MAQLQNSGFDFNRWVKYHDLDRDIVNALTRVKVTDDVTLVELSKNESEIKDLGLCIGDRLRLKKAIKYLNVPPSGVDTKQCCSETEEEERDYIDLASDGYETCTFFGPLPSKPPDAPLSFPVPVSREQSESLLRKKGKDRSFLVRQSSISEDSLSLSMVSDGECKHFPIQKTSAGKYHFGMHDYPELPALLRYYSQHPITNDSSRAVRLGEPLRLNEQDVKELGDK